MTVETGGRMRFVLGGILPYQRSWLRPDVIAGVSAGAVVIPQAMGYATVAGLPVEIGVYTCIFPLAVYALLGGARRLSFSTTSTIVALTGLGLSTVGVVDGPEAMDAVSTLTVMVGLCLLFFRLIRLGWMIEAVSEAVIDGLKVAVGLTIIADQLPKLLGIESAEGGFLSDVAGVWDQLGSVNAPTSGHIAGDHHRAVGPQTLGTTGPGPNPRRRRRDPPCRPDLGHRKRGGGDPRAPQRSAAPGAAVLRVRE